MHTTVLLIEAIEGLSLKSGMTIVDGTLGEGGHSAALAEAIGKDGTLIAIDRDRDSIARAKTKLVGAECRIEYVEGNFADLAAILARLGIETVDGILLDLGWNSGQFEGSGRGFSFAKDEPLLMTYAAESSEGELTAYEVVNSWSEADIAKTIWELGEDRASRRIAKAIVTARRKKPITTASELASLIEKAVGRHGKINPATRTFQALRIAVNDELGSLERGLAASLGSLKQNGRLAVISFHSLEDRIVKHFIKKHEDEGRLHRITKKPIVASETELQTNPRARSAKLRIAEKM
jgi:16S rRNA (cytosine1402-N4)-methyltransferase